MLEPAPGLLSITTGWPSDLESESWYARDTWSAAPPGAKPTTSFTGRIGYGWEIAGPGRKPITSRIQKIFLDKQPLADVCESLVCHREPVDHVARQRAREVQLPGGAHFLHRLDLELCHQQVGHRIGGGVARQLAAPDVGHVAEEFAGATMLMSRPPRTILTSPLAAKKK